MSDASPEETTLPHGLWAMRTPSPKSNKGSDYEGGLRFGRAIHRAQEEDVFSLEGEQETDGRQATVDVIDEPMEQLTEEEMAITDRSPAEKDPVWSPTSAAFDISSSPIQDSNAQSPEGRIHEHVNFSPQSRLSTPSQAPGSPWDPSKTNKPNLGASSPTPSSCGPLSLLATVTFRELQPNRHNTNPHPIHRAPRDSPPSNSGLQPVDGGQGEYGRTYQRMVSELHQAVDAFARSWTLGPHGAILLEELLTLSGMHVQPQ
ncbi:hypothetical protein IAU59_007546 [Kwoniella sp. CBS 9459]